jgi:hypothetical protein
VLSGIWVEVAALVAAFTIAVITTPAGVSGAVLLLPFQVSVLGTPSPSVTPTNLLYNVVASPGAIWRYRRQGQTGGTLTWLLLAGTLPGVVAGSVIRVYLLPRASRLRFRRRRRADPAGQLSRADASGLGCHRPPGAAAPPSHRAHRHYGRLCRRHLRHRRRIDPGAHPDR